MPLTRAQAALKDAQQFSVWEPYLAARSHFAPLTHDLKCDLAIVGGGFTGLWTAIEAKQRNPERHVVLIDGKTLGFGGSTRNGGFISESLTHGLLSLIHI